MDKFPLDDFPDYTILEYLERLPDEELLTMCQQPISKRIKKICEMDENIQKRVYDITTKPIYEAWERRDVDRESFLYGDRGFPVNFTGEDDVDRYLTRMSQVITRDDIYEPSPNEIPETYKDSYLYQLYIQPYNEIMNQFYKLKVTAPTLIDQSDIERKLIYQYNDNMSKWKKLSYFGVFPE